MNLTPEEQAVLESLTNPENQQTKFSWDDMFQKNLLSMLLLDDKMLVQSLDKVKPEYFSNEIHVAIAKILFEYFHERKSLPPEMVMRNELLLKIKDKDKSVQVYHIAELSSLYKYYVPGLETRDYLLDKVFYFAKVQAVKVAFHNCLEKMKKAPEDEKTWAYVYDQMRQSMLIERSYEPGLEYFNQIEEMFDRMKQQFDGKDRFTSGFPSIDNNLTGGGLFHGQIGAWIGLPGTGKSLALSKAAVANVLLGHRVLYLTMEIDEIGIAGRFTSQFTKVDINRLQENKDEVVKTIEEFKKDKENSNLLIVKQFPGGMIDVNGIRAYHAQLLLRGWKPDLIIVDYVGEMKDDPNVKKYESAYRILRDLRGFGVEQKHCTMTCLQPNQSAAKLELNEHIDESNIGTSFDQYKPLDAFWSINQRPIEKDAEIGRVFVIKHRNGQSRFNFKIAFDYTLGTLDLYEISNEKYKEMFSSSNSKKTEDLNFDQFSAGKSKKTSVSFEEEEE